MSPATGPAPRRRRALAAATGLCAALCALGLGAAQALAARTYDSNIPGFNSPSQVAFDASGNLWLSDAGHAVPKQRNTGPNGIYKYNPYPSQALLETPSTATAIGGSLGIQLAVDQDTNEVFVSQYNGRRIVIFSPASPTHHCAEGESICYSHTWSSINGTAGFEPGIHVAIDNSNSFSRGRVYMSLAHPEDDVEVLDVDRREVDFPATASYIDGNRLTGTPSGRFGEVEQITIDGSGNIYVTDAGRRVIDEFDSTGAYLRNFPAPNATVGNPGDAGVGIDPTNGNMLITEGPISESGEGGVREYDAYGNYLTTLPRDPTKLGGYQPEGTPGVSAAGYAYIPVSFRRFDIYTPTGPLPKITYGLVTGPTTTAGNVHATVDPNGSGSITGCHFEYGTSTSYASGELPCEPSTGFSGETEVGAGLSGLSTNTTYHYRVVVHSPNGMRYGADQTYTPQQVLGLTTQPATQVGEAGATLNASFVGNGEATSYHFEWGLTETYGHSAGAGSSSAAGPGATPLSTTLTELSPYTSYHFRVVAENGGGPSHGQDMTLTTTPGLPSIVSQAATSVHSDRAVLHAVVNPNGANTAVQFEYVTDSKFQGSGFAEATKTPVPIGVGMGKHPQAVEPQTVIGLEPGTLYHFRPVGTSEAGIGTPSADHTFTTFPFSSEVKDTCANAHVRQQTGASLLLDCRAYELVSAANSGGYDVESSLVVGQAPFSNYPDALAPSKVLYGVHDGGIPGTGDSTNHGVDPYVATRGEDGWTTRYVGIPADNPNAGAPFSSSLDEADAGLDTLAFGGESICSPCFSDGSTGTPIHLPDGELVQGLAGSIHQAAEPAGYIGRHLSADGSHFVFGTTTQLETDGNSNGDVSIYDRNLHTGATHVVSKTPAGATMTGPGIGELDVSSEGSRIVVGQLVSQEGSARYWHLYMNIGDSGKTVDLTPGSSSGALYDGMTADGSKVFFTTADALTTATSQDTDASPDLYEAEVDGAGAVTLSRVSTGAGGTGNGDSCDPAANTVREHWNSANGEQNCGVVALGTGGVAEVGGSVYFLSPEKLDGSGVQGAPNLFVSRPGQAPQFVATLESNASAPLPPPAHPFVRSFGTFENPAGVAIDHATGDVYVLDIGLESGTGHVYKFDPLGHPVTTWATGGVLTVGGAFGFYNTPGSLAVDNDPSSPSYRDLYVPELTEGAVRKFSPNTGEHIGDLEIGLPTGVATDPANGDVYATSLFGQVLIFGPHGGEPKSSFAASFSPSPTGIAVDSVGNSYIVNGGGIEAAKGTTEMYDASGTHLKTLDHNPSTGVAVDPEDDHVYVDEGNRVSEFDASGAPFGTPTGGGRLGGSIGLAADSGDLAISNLSQTSVALYGPHTLPPDTETDNPAVVDSVSAPEVDHIEDFEVTPSGNDAAFTSSQPLTGYDNGAVHREVFRYDTTDGLACASCNPTGEQAIGEASLPLHGLGLSDDGRVFFNSAEGLVDRDLNEREDAYEWEPDGFNFGHEQTPCSRPIGCVELISTGASPFASDLLGIGADGTDAYIYTRDKLSEQDENGGTVKIYDVRELGGFPFVPPVAQCKAADECHGPGSAVPVPPDIKSVAKSPGGNSATEKCKAGAVKRHGACVKRKRHHRKHHKHDVHKGGRHHG